MEKIKSRHLQIYSKPHPVTSETVVCNSAPNVFICVAHTLSFCQAAALGAIAGVDLDLMCGSDMDKFSYIHLLEALEEGLVRLCWFSVTVYILPVFI